MRIQFHVPAYLLMNVNTSRLSKTINDRLAGPAPLKPAPNRAGINKLANATLAANEVGRAFIKKDAWEKLRHGTAICQWLISEEALDQAKEKFNINDTVELGYRALMEVAGVAKVQQGE